MLAVFAEFERNILRLPLLKDYPQVRKDFTTALTTGYVLRPDEKLTDERVVQETGSYVTARFLHLAVSIEPL